MNRDELAGYLESTLIRPDATADDFRRLCGEAMRFRMRAVCVPSSRVVLARHELEGSEVRVVTAAGFPLGNEDRDAKRYEVEMAVDLGAHEIDVVLNAGLLKEGDNPALLRELHDIVEAADERPVKVILEMSVLAEAEVRRACSLLVEAGAHFVKTGTGFGPRGVTVDDVELLRREVGPQVGVKAAGGIRHYTDALALIRAGATRLGTTSACALLEQAPALPAEPESG